MSEFQTTAHSTSSGRIGSDVAAPSPWTPQKIGLIATLSVVLVVVLYVQFGGQQESGPTISLARPVQNTIGSSSSTSPSASPSASVSSAQPAPVSPSASNAVASRPSKSSHNWPVIPRATVQKFNPFRENRFSGDGQGDDGDLSRSSAQPGEIAQYESGESGERSSRAKSERENRRRIAEVERERAERLEAYRRERQRELDELLASRVGLLLLKPQGNRAIVDHRVVRTGDVIDGFVITDITPQGVEFVDQQAEPE